MTKRFLLFAGRMHYPGGGWDDFVGSFDMIDEARSVATTLATTREDWTQIVDTAGEYPVFAADEPTPMPIAVHQQATRDASAALAKEYGE